MRPARAATLGSQVIKRIAGARQSVSTEQTQQIYDEMRMLESQYASISQQEAVLGNAYREAQSVAATMRAAKESPEIDTLVPVGSGVFLDAHISDSQSVILNVGAGIAIRKDIGYAANYIEMRIKELGVAIENAAGQKQQIAARIQQGRQEFERLAHSAAGPAKGDV